MSVQGRLEPISVCRYQIQREAGYPQKVLEDTGARYQEAGPEAPCVVLDGKPLTGQSQQSASEYGIVLYHLLSGRSPVVCA